MVEFSELESGGELGEPAAYLNRGIAYASKWEYDLAIADFSQAIALNPGFAVAYLHRGIAYFHEGEVDLAISDYNRSITLNPGDADAYYYRGRAYLRNKEYELSVADFSQAIVLNPGYADPTTAAAWPTRLKGSMTWPLPTTAEPLP